MTAEARDIVRYYAAAAGLGICGALVMTTINTLALVGGWSRFDLSLWLGTFWTEEPGAWWWVLGFFTHLGLGAMFGLAYGLAMDCWGGASWARGAGIGVIHALLVGAIIQWAPPLLHPIVRGHRLFASPDYLFAAYGPATAFLFWALHAVFGAILGGGLSVTLRGKGRPSARGTPRLA